MLSAHARNLPLTLGPRSGVLSFPGCGGEAGLPILAAPQLPPEPFTKTVSTKVGTTTHTQVKAAAAKQSVSMAEVVRRALAAYLTSTSRQPPQDNED